MKTVLLLCILVAVSADNEPEKAECEGVHVRGKFHKKEILGRALNRPYQLGLLRHSHKIFFSFNIGSDEEDTFKIGFIEKNHTSHQVLEDVENGFALAVDDDNHVAYFGGSSGIYRYHDHPDNQEHKVTKILHDHNIWDMFYKKQLYFITFPKQHLYKLDVHKNGSKPERVKDIHEEIYQFAIDGDNDKFMTNETGLFRIKSGSKLRVHYKGETVFRAIEINNKGEAFFSGKHCISVADKKKHELEEIAHVKNIFGLAFDHEDNIIYSDPHEIIRLLPEECEEIPRE